MFTPVVILLFALFGSFAGFLAGLLGIGGGVILVPLFLWAFAHAGFSDTVLVHLAIGTSLTIIFPTTVSSTLGHFRNGHVNPTQVLYMSIGAVIGALCGATLAAFVDGGHDDAPSGSGSSPGGAGSSGIASTSAR